MKVTLLEDGIYGNAGEVVEIGTKKAIEMGLFGTKTTIETTIEENEEEVVEENKEETTTEENEEEVVVNTKIKKHR